MWKRSDVVEGKRYCLSLNQFPSGHRTFTLHEVDASYLPPEAKLVTREVPNELLFRGGVDVISKSVLTTEGRSFFVDAHGVWLTEEELDALESDEDVEVPWLNGLAPHFAPK